MKEFTITTNDAGQRLDRWLAKAIPLLPASLAQKYIRLKRIKLNGKRAERDTRLTAGDTLQLYINDEFFDTPKEENAYLTVAAPKLHIVYEDENILLVDKKPGQAVHPHDGAEYGKTLIDHIQAYLYAKREWRPREEHAFAPALCNRIDRNTGGIVIAAKNAEALRILNQKIKDREIDKRYLCIVHGTPRPASGRLEGQLFKDAKENRVYITKTKTTIAPANNIERRRGTITIDNETAGRYMGELDIMKRALPADPRVNVCARIVSEDLPLLGCITPGRKFSFALRSRNAGEHDIMKDNGSVRANATQTDAPNADESSKETREEPAS